MNKLHSKNYTPCNNYINYVKITYLDNRLEIGYNRRVMIASGME